MGRDGQESIALDISSRTGAIKRRPRKRAGLDACHGLRIGKQTRRQIGARHFSLLGRGVRRKRETGLRTTEWSATLAPPALTSFGSARTSDCSAHGPCCTANRPLARLGCWQSKANRCQALFASRGGGKAEARGRTADHGVVRDFGVACVDIVSFGANDRLFVASAVLHRDPAAGAARLMEGNRCQAPFTSFSLLGVGAGG
jgi:hypothetical protein